MGHSRDLLERIAADVTSAWPSEQGYRIEFERPLAVQGVRGMLPDIQVLDAGGQVRCAVEIGYTRPEKLTAYRAPGIPDVRWYDKAGTIHGDVNLRVEVVRREERVRPSRTLVFKQLDVNQQATCWDCVAGDIAGRCGCGVDPCECNPLVPLSQAQENALYGGEIDLAHRETVVTALSNGVRYIALLYCDECGGTGVLDDDRMWTELFIHDAMDFDAAHHRFKYGRYRQKTEVLQAQGIAIRPIDRSELTYVEVIEMAQALYGLDIDYDQFTVWA